MIDAAIQEVKRSEASRAQTVRKLTKTQERLRAFKMASPKAKAQGKAAQQFERMVNLAEKKILKSQRQATAQASSMAEALAEELFHKPGSILTSQELAKIYQESECVNVVEPPPNCNEPVVQKHRTANGVCNNLRFPTRGAAFTPLLRLISSRYEDGLSTPRAFLQSQDSPLFRLGPFGTPYASPRVISMGVVRDREDNDTTHSHILMQWGQFMDHDLDLIPEFEPDDCPEGCEITSENQGMCYPFRVPEDDQEVMVSRTDPEAPQCHEFRRSVPICPSEEEEEESPFILRPREQINAITHWIDGSMVYHHDPDVLNNMIRDPDSDSGQLRVGPPATQGMSHIMH